MSENVRITTVGMDRLMRKAENRLRFLEGDQVMLVIVTKSGDELVASFKKTIDTFRPGPVRDLAESTKKQKIAKVGRAYPILDRTGEFIKSMVSNVSFTKQMWKIRVAYKGMHPTGNILNERLARIHIKGEGRMPARDFTGIPKDWRRRLMDRIRAEIKRRD